MLGEYIKFCLLNEMQSMNNKPQIFNFGFVNCFPPLFRYPLEKSNTLLFNIRILYMQRLQAISTFYKGKTKYTKATYLLITLMVP